MGIGLEISMRFLIVLINRHKYDGLVKKTCVSESNGVKVMTHLHSSRFETVSAADAYVCVCLFWHKRLQLSKRNRSKCKQGKPSNDYRIFIFRSSEHLGIYVWESILE